MDLDAYLERIGYAGPRDVSFATLDGVMRAHIASVPFENLDVQLGRPLSTDIPAIYAKIVGQRRGGWCYEQNGVLGWALSEMGFDVSRLGGGVMRVVLGDRQIGNHLALKVVLDGTPWLADAGFGGSHAGPIPLAAGEHWHPPFNVALTHQEDGHWRFSEHAPGADPFSYDFRDGPADETLLSTRCGELQSDPESLFVQNLIAQRRVGDSHVTLRGRVFATRTAEGQTRRTIGSADELVAVLRDAFGLDLPEAASLWDSVCARHAALFPEETA